MNNPTIDGVSLLPCPCCGSKELSIRYHSPQAYWIQCDDCESESRAFDSKTALLAHWNTRVAPPEVTALQSTIAQLQARIAELESGRGEPVYQVKSTIRDRGWRDVTKGRFDVSQNPCWESRTLFTAPPAPVAVVLPERELFEQHIIERDGGIRVSVLGDARSYNEPIERDYSVWQACLDATAALNSPTCCGSCPAGCVIDASKWVFIEANRTGKSQGVCCAIPAVAGLMVSEGGRK